MLPNHSEIRSLFPFTENFIYLDSAHYTPYPKNIVEKLNEFLCKFSTEYLNLSLYQLQLAEDARRSAANLVNADAEDIILTSNTTHGINIFVNGINLAPGDNNVAVLDSEFPAVVYPWLNQERLGRVKLLLIPSENGYANEAIIKRILLEHNVRIFSISYVQFLGYRYNIKSISDFCKKNKILLVVDAIQAAGICPIDVEGMGVDYFCAGNQKWLMSPAGAGFAYISKEYQQYVNPTYVSTANINYDFENFLDYKLDFKTGGQAYENSTWNLLGILGMKEVMDFFMRLGVENIFNHIIEIQDQFMNRLDKGKYIIKSDLSPEHRSNILLFSHADQGRNKEIQKSLESKHIFIALREGFLRLSPHIYNNYEDVETLASELNNS
jgi:cysteine desulfurase/selenocysteine lyase